MLKVFLVIPHEGRDPLIAIDPQPPQRVGQPRGLLTDLSVRRVPEAVAGGGADGAVTVDVERVPPDLGDGEREVLHGALH
jgi:hypothetical protein